jgi:hypothetical protein
MMAGNPLQSSPPTCDAADHDKGKVARGEIFIRIEGV